MLRLSMSFTDEMASGVQEFLEKLIEPKRDRQSPDERIAAPKIA
jgi:hypothetical protein